MIEFHDTPLSFPCLSHYSRVIAITDENVAKLCEIPFEHIIILPPGEGVKTLAMAEHCWQKLAEIQADRRSLIVAIGGGSITDLAGFVAACYMRGIDYISYPTTLLAMVDASIGGKTAVNLGLKKNYIGAFHQPKEVHIFPNLLKTLPLRELKAGLAEIIKAAVIADSPFFTRLENSIAQIVQGDMGSLRQAIARACEIKAEIVAVDEKEGNIRAMLNFGHSFGHAIESATRFSRFLHGEAVALGMVLEAKLSQKLGFCSQETVDRIEQICQKIGLPTILSDVPTNQILEHMKSDKKNFFGKFSLIVVQKIGKVVSVEDVDKVILEETLRS